MPIAAALYRLQGLHGRANWAFYRSPLEIPRDRNDSNSSYSSNSSTSTISNDRNNSNSSNSKSSASSNNRNYSSNSHSSASHSRNNSHSSNNYSSNSHSRNNSDSSNSSSNSDRDRKSTQGSAAALKTVELSPVTSIGDVCSSSGCSDAIAVEVTKALSFSEASAKSLSFVSPKAASSLHKADAESPSGALPPATSMCNAAATSTAVTLPEAASLCSAATTFPSVAIAKGASTYHAAAEASPTQASPQAAFVHNAGVKSASVALPQNTSICEGAVKLPSVVALPEAATLSKVSRNSLLSAPPAAIAELSPLCASQKKEAGACSFRHTATGEYADAGVSARSACQATHTGEASCCLCPHPSTMKDVRGSAIKAAPVKNTPIEEAAAISSVDASATEEEEAATAREAAPDRFVAVQGADIEATAATGHDAGSSYGEFSRIAAEAPPPPIAAPTTQGADAVITAGSTSGTVLSSMSHSGEGDVAGGEGATSLPYASHEPREDQQQHKEEYCCDGGRAASLRESSSGNRSHISSRKHLHAEPVEVADKDTQVVACAPRQLLVVFLGDISDFFAPSLTSSGSAAVREQRHKSQNQQQQQQHQEEEEEEQEEEEGRGGQKQHSESTFFRSQQRRGSSREQEQQERKRGHKEERWRGGVQHEPQSQQKPQQQQTYTPHAQHQQVEEEEKEEENEQEQELKQQQWQEKQQQQQSCEVIEEEEEEEQSKADEEEEREFLCSHYPYSLEGVFWVLSSRFPTQALLLVRPAAVVRHHAVYRHFMLCDTRGIPYSIEESLALFRRHRSSHTASSAGENNTSPYSFFPETSSSSYITHSGIDGSNSCSSTTVNSSRSRTSGSDRSATTHDCSISEVDRTNHSSNSSNSINTKIGRDSTMGSLEGRPSSATVDDANAHGLCSPETAEEAVVGTRQHPCACQVAEGELSPRQPQQQQGSFKLASGMDIGREQKVVPGDIAPDGNPLGTAGEDTSEGDVSIDPFSATQHLICLLNSLGEQLRQQRHGHNITYQSVKQQQHQEDNRERLWGEQPQQQQEQTDMESQWRQQQQQQVDDNLRKKQQQQEEEAHTEIPLWKQQVDDRESLQSEQQPPQENGNVSQRAQQQLQQEDRGSLWWQRQRQQHQGRGSLSLLRLQLMQKQQSVCVQQAKPHGKKEETSQHQTGCQTANEQAQHQRGDESQQPRQTRREFQGLRTHDTQQRAERKTKEPTVSCDSSLSNPRVCTPSSSSSHGAVVCDATSCSCEVSSPQAAAVCEAPCCCCEVTLDSFWQSTSITLLGFSKGAAVVLSCLRSKCRCWRDCAVRRHDGCCNDPHVDIRCFAPPPEASDAAQRTWKSAFLYSSTGDRRDSLLPENTIATTAASAQAPEKAAGEMQSRTNNLSSLSAAGSFVSASSCCTQAPVATQSCVEATTLCSRNTDVSAGGAALTSAANQPCHPGVALASTHSSITAAASGSDSQASLTTTDGFTRVRRYCRNAAMCPALTSFWRRVHALHIVDGGLSVPHVLFEIPRSQLVARLQTCPVCVFSSASSRRVVDATCVQRSTPIHDTAHSFPTSDAQEHWQQQQPLRCGACCCLEQAGTSARRSGKTSSSSNGVSSNVFDNSVDATSHAARPPTTTSIPSSTRVTCANNNTVSRSNTTMGGRPHTCTSSPSPVTETTFRAESTCDCHVVPEALKTLNSRHAVSLLRGDVDQVKGLAQANAVATAQQMSGCEAEGQCASSMRGENLAKESCSTGRVSQLTQPGAEGEDVEMGTPDGLKEIWVHCSSRQLFDGRRPFVREETLGFLRAVLRAAELCNASAREGATSRVDAAECIKRPYTRHTRTALTTVGFARYYMSRFQRRTLCLGRRGSTSVVASSSETAAADATDRLKLSRHPNSSPCRMLMGRFLRREAETGNDGTVHMPTAPRVELEARALAESMVVAAAPAGVPVAAPTTCARTTCADALSYSLQEQEVHEDIEADLLSCRVAVDPNFGLDVHFNLLSDAALALQLASRGPQRCSTKSYTALAASSRVAAAYENMRSCAEEGGAATTTHNAPAGHGDSVERHAIDVEPGICDESGAAPHKYRTFFPSCGRPRGKVVAFVANSDAVVHDAVSDEKYLELDDAGELIESEQCSGKHRLREIDIPVPATVFFEEWRELSGTSFF